MSALRQSRFQHATGDVRPSEAFTLDFDLTKLEGWKPMQGALTARGIYTAKNEFRGKADWPKLQTIWEGKLVTEPVKITLSVAATRPS